jgi:hypothetical protein
MCKSGLWPHHTAHPPTYERRDVWHRPGHRHRHHGDANLEAELQQDVGHQQQQRDGLQEAVLGLRPTRGHGWCGCTRFIFKSGWTIGQKQQQLTTQAPNTQLTTQVPNTQLTTQDPETHCKRDRTVLHAPNPAAAILPLFTGLISQDPQGPTCRWRSFPPIMYSDAIWCSPVVLSRICQRFHPPG